MVKSKQRVCKLLNAMIKDEQMACHKDYNKIAKEMKKLDKGNTRTLIGIRRDECRHHNLVKAMKKKHCRK